jgi:hypothetical protein
MPSVVMLSTVPLSVVVLRVSTEISITVGLNLSAYTVQASF